MAVNGTKPGQVKTWTSVGATTSITLKTSRLTSGTASRPVSNSAQMAASAEATY